MSDIEKEAREALIKRATGYDYEEKKIIADKNGRPQKVEVYKKHMPPDLGAINTLISEFWYEELFERHDQYNPDK